MVVENLQGIVKWFNNTKGFGFINTESLAGDIFAHYSSIQMDGYLTLKAGQSVTFNVEETPTGFHAKNIIPAPPQA
ncbi:cold shock domain-containing protein [Thalassomonas actiniarum]|uniref:Cold shock domain-containing protein n=1 Tax=Thalassomonas actiniarum TaxID=485447 RepID=A0AAE9YNJ9_9GAMM|nr:cold shock domain-containing protein [Thalassomonas actiniarum]WDD98315.1 cold shock domain-containing protein [Thalassomonas actiniarum]